MTFRLDLRRADPDLWMTLGEIQSKCEHIAGVPLRPTTAERLHGLYLAKGVLATTAIEGNTLSEEEVLQQIEGKLDLPESKRYLGQEISNVVEACNHIGDTLFAGGTADVSSQEICEFNRLILDRLPIDDEVNPGSVRTHGVVVRGVGYGGAPAEDCEYLLGRLCDWLNSDEFRPRDKSSSIALAVLKAIIAHVYIAWIHPFGDGNGRTARLVEFKILLASGVPSPAAHLLSNFYNETRQEYYRQLNRTSASGGDLLPFIKYAITGFRDELRKQLQIIRNQQWDVTWRNYVHEKFRDMTRPSDVRRRHLALDLSSRVEPIPISGIPEVSPRLARLYAQRSTQTLHRDVEALVKMGLVELTVGGVRARRETILSFLPRRKNVADSGDKR